MGADGPRKGVTMWRTWGTARATASLVILGGQAEGSCRRPRECGAGTEQVPGPTGTVVVRLAVRTLELGV